MQLSKSLKSTFIGVIGYTATSLTPLFADSFSYGNGTTISTSQTLNESETGVIESGAQVITEDAGSGSIVMTESANLTNSGTIIAASNTTSDAVGIYAGHKDHSNNSNNTITNYGSISTTNSSTGQSIGIHLQNSQNGTVVNSGKISTSRSTSGTNIGVYLQYAHGSQAQNSGSIINNSDSAVSYGMLTTGSNNSVVVNSGSINITSDASSSGLRITGNTSNNTTTNSGSIELSSSRTQHTGIRVDGSSNTTITNSGSISLSGGHSGHTAIRLEDADDLVINNSGSLNASQAILFDSDSLNTTLNILSGSKIVGSIQLQGSNDTVNIAANTYSSDLYIEGAETINLTGTAIKINEGGGNTRIITLGSMNETSRSIALADFSSSVHSVINQRLTRPKKRSLIQLASLTFSPELLFQTKAPVFWSQFFGGRREDDSSDNAYTQSHYGINLGYEKDYNKMRVGVVGGVSNSTVDTDASTGDTTSYYTGLYTHYYFDQFNVTASIIGGIGSHNNKRLVVSNSSGTEVAKSDFYSAFVSPSIGIHTIFKFEQWDLVELRPAASLDYSLSYLPDYQESGTTRSNFQVEDRVVSALSGKAELAIAYQYSPSLEVNLKAGVNLLEAEKSTVTARLNGTEIHLSNSNSSNGVGHFIGLGIQTALDSHVDISAELEIGTFGESESYITGTLNAEYAF